MNDIQEAYGQFLHINVLDISKEGQDLWDSTKRNYDNKIDKVESQITIALKERLASTGNANEMFKVFSFFKPLFSRQRIKGAIREYQNQILQQVSKDIQALKEKFLSERENEQSNILSGLRDIPTVANNITWATQIKKKVKMYQERVKQVLGDDFDQD